MSFRDPLHEEPSEGAERVLRWHHAIGTIDGATMDRALEQYTRADQLPDAEDVSLDYETYSEVDLRKSGAYVYAEDYSTDLLCAAYAFDDEPVALWLPGMPCPPRLARHILAGRSVRAWNAAFERALWRDCAGPKYDWPVPALEQYVCTMVEAMAMALPGKLEFAAPALKVDQAKDKAGSRVMLQLSKPRKAANGVKPAVRWTPQGNPEKFKTLYAYCIQDVVVERAVKKRVIRLIPQERERWLADQRANDRGICLDAKLVNATARAVEIAKQRNNEEMRRVTSMEVSGTSAVQPLVKWLCNGGLNMTSLRKDQVVEALARDDLTDQQRRALELRQESGKSSTAKLDAMLLRASRDGRIKGPIQFHGASTGRDAGRGLQVQNFPRPDEDFNVDAAIEDLYTSNVDLIELLHGPTLSVASQCLRGMLVPGPGKKLWSRDLSQIEARMLAWLAGAENLLQAFRDFDAKIGPDLYKVAAAGIYNVALADVTKAMRQIGKVAVLALGYGGGALAFASMARAYGLDIGLAYDAILEVTSPENRLKAQEAWKARGVRSGMVQRRFLAAEMVKLAWREDNPDIVAFWYALVKAAIAAVKNPGQAFRVNGKITYKKRGSFLACKLPSGRSIWYPYPKVITKVSPWGREQDALVYWGIDGFTHKWAEQDLNHLIASENATQAASACVMFDAVRRLDRAGYPNIFKVHDEAISETDEGFGDEDEFHEIFTGVPPWANSLPIAADGWSGGRYRK